MFGMFGKQELAQQIIKTYHGGNLDRQFQHDATRLAKQGYMVTSSTYGGTRRAGLGSALTLGVFGGRKPKDLTVIYMLQKTI